MVPNWFREAVVYSLDVRTFCDSNADGRGDLQGLIEHLPYLQELGVNCIWLAPFYVSNEYDDGYDVIDYFDIDPHLGTLEDFGELVQSAKSVGIHIVLDLIVNHTSIHHPWFKRALENPDSIYYDYYIWSKDAKKDSGEIMFPGVEDSTWHHAPEVDAFYYHSFYRHQADLNITNPRVQAEITRILNFWMGTGISGFRIDAVPLALRNKGGIEFEQDAFELLNDWRSVVTGHNKDAVLLGEADVDPQTYSKFLEHDRLTALFNFYINNYTFFSFATQKSAPLYQAIKLLPMAQGEHYLHFLRNHDELELGILKASERKEVFSKFAPDKNMQIYGRGIRRRWPPMAENDLDRVKMSMSLLISLPGTPVIRYGEEIGMGDDLNLPERRSVRTVMQWSDGDNAGFSELPPQAMHYPLIRMGEYNFKEVNVKAQKKEPKSLWNTVKGLLQLRKKWQSSFAHGQFHLVTPGHESLLAYMYTNSEGALLVVHNLSDKKISSELAMAFDNLSDFKQIVGDAEVRVADSQVHLKLGRYGYSWIVLPL